METRNAHESHNVIEPRVRSINFTPQEKRVLTSLISKHPSINTKYCDNGSLSAKHISWHEVYDRFCAHFPIQPLRDIKQLKGCWKRLKMKRKLYPYDPSKWYGADDNSSDVSMAITTPIKTEIKTEGNNSQRVDSPNHTAGSTNDALNTSFNSSSDSSTCNVNTTQNDVKPPIDVANLEVTMNFPEANGNRVKDVATTLQEFVANRHQGQHSADNKETPNLISRRKNITPRRLPVRPITSYMRPPVSTISETSNSHDSDDTTTSDDLFLKMSRREHRAKMRILKLKEWKLKHECLSLKIGLPPNYTESDDDDHDL